MLQLKKRTLNHFFLFERISFYFEEEKRSQRATFDEVSWMCTRWRTSNQQYDELLEKVNVNNNNNNNNFYFYFYAAVFS